MWIDAGELRTGDSLVERLAEGIAEADVVVALISRHSVDSSWCRKEVSLAMTQEIDADRWSGVRAVLPVRVGRVEMPPTLRDKVYIEAKRKHPEQIVPKLWEDIRHHVDGAGGSGSGAPSEAELSYQRGLNLYGKGELTAAKRELHDASQESHHAAALLLGTILLDQGELEKASSELGFAAGSEDEETATAAIVAYGRMIATHEFDTEARAVAGARGGLLGHRDLEEAEKLWLVAANSGHRDAAWAWVGLGRLRADPATRDATPDPAGAEQAFDQAVSSAHAASRACALFKLGRTRWGLGMDAEAVPVLELGATSGDREWSPRCAFELGRLYWKQGKDEDAGHWWYEAGRSSHPDIAAMAREALEDPSSPWRAR